VVEKMALFEDMKNMEDMIYSGFVQMLTVGDGGDG
jgi:hypothetical protein